MNSQFRLWRDITFIWFLVGAGMSILFVCTGVVLHGVAGICAMRLAGEMFIMMQNYKAFEVLEHAQD